MNHPKTFTLPAADLYLTDGGLETWLVFQEGIELPACAAFPLLASAGGRARLERYYRPFLEQATAAGTGFVLESPTWRASRDWGRRLGYDPALVMEFNRQGIALLAALKDEYASRSTPVAVSGALGPRDDAHRPAAIDPIASYEDYHAEQIAALAAAGAELVTAFAIANIAEAIGITRAAQRAGIPVVLSFTVETDARLPTGHGLREAIELVDAATRSGPAYYMVSCAHPQHVEAALTPGPWLERLKGIRANAARRSDAGPDAAPTPDGGDPQALAQHYAALRRRLPALTVLGGTDHRHAAAIAKTCKRSGVRRLVKWIHEERAAIALGALAFLLFGYLMITLHYAIEYPTVI